MINDLAREVASHQRDPTVLHRIGRHIVRRAVRQYRRLLRPRPPAIVRAVRAANLTYLKPDALTDLYATLRRVERAGVPGSVVEAGCALGGSAIVLAAAKSPARPLYVYDVFGMIPPPSGHDGPDIQDRYEVIRNGRAAGIGGDRYYGYEEDLLGKVADSFRRHGFPPERHNVHLVKGLFQDTLHPAGPVALAHLDGDWYESVMTCLRRIEPRLSVGGVFVIDDYDAWSGCREAVDEYFADKRDRFRFDKKSRLHIERVA